MVGVVAFVVPDGELTCLDVRQAASERLPATMLPEESDALADRGTNVTIVGAGVTGFGAFSDRLYFATGTVQNYYDGGVMEVSFATQGICGGDSGGPVFTTVRGSLYLSGVINARADDVGTDCGRTLYAARLDGAMRSWIRDAENAERASF